MFPPSFLHPVLTSPAPSPDPCIAFPVRTPNQTFLIHPVFILLIPPFPTSMARDFFFFFCKTNKSFGNSLEFVPLAKAKLRMSKVFLAVHSVVTLPRNNLRINRMFLYVLVQTEIILIGPPMS